MAVRLLPLPREEFRQLNLILHSELRRRAASRRALPCPSSYYYFVFEILVYFKSYFEQSNITEYYCWQQKYRLTKLPIQTFAADYAHK